jgi:hypothetical protein
VLILDDILLAPFRGIFWVFRKIHEAARAELEGQQQRITSELSELYMQLDTGKITEQEFDARERVLLARLDAVKANLRQAKSGGKTARATRAGQSSAPLADEDERAPE